MSGPWEDPISSSRESSRNRSLSFTVSLLTSNTDFVPTSRPPRASYRSLVDPITKKVQIVYVLRWSREGLLGRAINVSRSSRRPRRRLRFLRPLVTKGRVTGAPLLLTFPYICSKGSFTRSAPDFIASMVSSACLAQRSPMSVMSRRCVD